MLTNFMLVGKVVKKPEVTKTSKGTSVAHLLVECERPYRNEDGSLTKDTFNITLWKGIAEECQDFCEEGSFVAIKGRLQSNAYESDGKEYHNTEIVAEKVIYRFASS